MGVPEETPKGEPALGSSHEELSRLLATLPAAAYICDADGLITFFNQRAVEFWGREPKLNDPMDRFCGSFKLFAADGLPLPHDECWMSLALRNNKAYHGHEIVVERPDGSRWTALAHVSPFQDERGRVVGAVNILVDITDRRRAELENAHLAAIVDSSEDAIISKNLNGVIQTWNAAAQRLFGYTAEQAIGRHISFLIPAERSHEEDEILARLRAGEPVYHFDTTRIRSDGELIHVSLTISPIRDDAGRVVGASKIARDISDRKKAEEQVYGLLTQLKEADRRKDEFLATLAHELRGPLAPLRSLLEIMKRGNGNGDLLEQIRHTMERQLGQMVRLVNDLLDVSRITTNKLELHKERVELSAAIGHAVEAVRPLIECAEHEIVVNLPSEPIYLHADPIRLAQVFINLLNNACKYTDPKGNIQLTAEREGTDAIVKVKDSGIGIPPDKLAKVFVMFSQLHTGTDRSRGGLGIGLTVVKRLVEMHGGSVGVISEGPGRGTEFFVRLPIMVDQPQTEEQQQPTEKGRATMARRILVVDDNTDSAASLALLLQMCGHETSTAHDGLAALAAVEGFRPHVLLLDISLPKLDGYAVARRIREQPWGKDLLLVALTGWGQEEDRRRSKEAGFDEHMVKPMDFDALMKLLASV
jgi:two-component system CheB/CheR fusion protein